MILTNNYQINTIYVDVDGFRGATATIDILRMIDSKTWSTGLWRVEDNVRWGVYELNFSPTQSGPSASIWGFTGPGITVSYGQYDYQIKKDNLLLEKGILWVMGDNNGIY